jgi:hypothetical protein
MLVLDVGLLTNLAFSEWVDDVNKAMEDQVGYTIDDVKEQVSMAQMFYDYEAGIEPAIEAGAIQAYLER